MKKLITIALLALPVVAIHAANVGERIQSAMDVARKQQADETKSTGGIKMAEPGEPVATASAVFAQELAEKARRRELAADLEKLKNDYIYELRIVTARAGRQPERLLTLHERVKLLVSPEAYEKLQAVINKVKAGMAEKYESNGSILPERSTPERSTPASSVLTPPVMGQPTNFR